MRIPFWLLVAAAAAATLAVTLQLNPFASFIATRIMIYLILALGLNILMGYAGQLAFAHAALFGIGAYATGLLQVRLGFGFAPSAGLAVLITTLVGGFLTLPALRLSGLYLALSTLAFAQAVQWTMLNWVSLTFGPGGFHIPPLTLGFGFDRNQSVLILATATAAILFVLTDNLLRSRFGRRFVAIRDNPVAAASMGVNVTATKFTAFALSAAFAGLAGAISSALLGFVSPESYNLDHMVMMQIMVVIGGLGSIVGSLIGPVVVVLLIEALRESQALLEILFGLTMVGFVLFQPKGIAAMLSRVLPTVETFMPRALARKLRDRT